MSHNSIGTLAVVGVLLGGAVWFYDTHDTTTPAVPLQGQVSAQVDTEVPQRITVEGIWECVPLKPGETAEDECVLGVARYQSDAHFVVDTLLMSAMLNVEVGDHVRVEGVMVPANQLNSDHRQKYPIDGIINATTVQKIEPKTF